MNEQGKEGRGPFVMMILEEDPDKFEAEVEKAIKGGWLLHGPWQWIEDNFFSQMMLHPVEVPAEQVEMLEERVQRLEMALGSLVGQLRQGVSTIARPGIVLDPTKLKGGH
jgi:hypothetical protein